MLTIAVFCMGFWFVSLSDMLVSSFRSISMESQAKLPLMAMTWVTSDSKNQVTSDRSFHVPSDRLELRQLLEKGADLILSPLAFNCEPNEDAKMSRLSRRLDSRGVECRALQCFLVQADMAYRRLRQQWTKMVLQECISLSSCSMAQSLPKQPATLLARWKWKSWVGVRIVGPDCMQLACMPPKFMDGSWAFNVRATKPNDQKKGNDKNHL